VGRVFCSLVDAVMHFIPSHVHPRLSFVCLRTGWLVWLVSFRLTCTVRLATKNSKTWRSSRRCSSAHVPALSRSLRLSTSLFYTLHASQASIWPRARDWKLLYSAPLVLLPIASALLSTCRHCKTQSIYQSSCRDPTAYFLLALSLLHIPPPFHSIASHPIHICEDAIHHPIMGTRPPRYP